MVLLRRDVLLSSPEASLGLLPESDDVASMIMIKGKERAVPTISQLGDVALSSPEDASQ